MRFNVSRETRHMWLHLDLAVLIGVVCTLLAQRFLGGFGVAIVIVAFVATAIIDWRLS